MQRLALLLLLPGAAVAQVNPVMSEQNLRALTEVLQSPAAQNLLSTQLGQIGTTAQPAANAGVAGLLGANLGNAALVLQNFTPEEIAAMQKFALSPEGQSIAAKIPGIIQQLQAQGAVPAAGK